MPDASGNLAPAAEPAARAAALLSRYRVRDGLDLLRAMIRDEFEGRIALDEVLSRFPEWEVDLENARLSPTTTVRGWETLPVSVP